MTESEKEKKIFLSYCGSRDQELLMGRKKMTLGDMERFSFLTEFFGLESYGINLFASVLTESVQKSIDKNSYGEPVTVTVKVEKNHSGTYELSETERNKLETAMFPTE